MPQMPPDLVPEWLHETPLYRIRRIDLGLEFAWNETYATIWTPDDGFLGLGRVPERHPVGRHALELYMDDGWIGIHCFRREGEESVLVREQVAAIMEFVAEQLEDRRSQPESVDR